MQPPCSQPITTRRADLDWLRVIAFGILIYFHTAIAFLPSQSLPLIMNAQPSHLADVAVSFSHQFRLALLFLISGVGVCFAQRHRNRTSFFRERSQRLLMPLLFGILVLVPPMVFLEKRYLDQIDISFLQFYPKFFTQGVYPTGNLSWHHFWFVAYLYLFCLLSWPLFQFLGGSCGSKLVSRWVARVQIGPGLILVPAVVLTLVEVPLRPVFPGFRDLIHDWASFAHWFAIFMAGYLLATNEPLLNRAEVLRYWSLGLAVACTLALFGIFWSPGADFNPNISLDPAAGSTLQQLTAPMLLEWILFCALRMLNVWCWLLVCLGFASRHLQRTGPVLAYLNGAVYPLFCVHLTLIVALEYIVLPLDWSIAAKYWTITSATVLLALACYEIIRRVSLLAPLFGIRNAV